LLRKTLVLTDWRALCTLVVFGESDPAFSSIQRESCKGTATN
jgi:hypothetical protein